MDESKKPNFDGNQVFSGPCLVIDKNGEPWWIDTVNRTMVAATVTQDEAVFHIGWAMQEVAFMKTVRRPSGAYIKPTDSAANVILTLDDLLASDWEVVPT